MHTIHSIEQPIINHIKWKIRKQNRISFGVQGHSNYEQNLN